MNVIFVSFYLHIVIVLFWKFDFDQMSSSSDIVTGGGNGRTEVTDVNIGDERWIKFVLSNQQNNKNEIALPMGLNWALDDYTCHHT